MIGCRGLFRHKVGILDNSQILWPGSQVVRQGSAKPLCVGAIPTRASKFGVIGTTPAVASN